MDNKYSPLNGRQIAPLNNPQSESFFFFILFIVSFLFRIYMNLNGGELAGALQGTWVPGGDAATYDELGKNILNGKGLVLALDCFRYYSLDLPFYPVFLSFIYAIFGYNWVAVMIIQGVLGAFVPIFVCLIGKYLFNRKVGYTSGIITAFYLPFVLCTFTMMRETLFIFLFVCSIYLLIKTVNPALSAIEESHDAGKSGVNPASKGKGMAVITGIFMGITSLTRGFGYGLVLLSILWIFIIFVKNLKNAFILSFYICFSFCLVIFPWVLRNYFVHNGFLLGETTGGRHFWTGANPKYDGHHLNADAWKELLWRDPDATEMEVEKRCWREGIEFITKDPISYIDLCRKRRDRLWGLPNPREIFGNIKTVSLNWAEDASVLLVVYLGIIGMVISIGNWKRSGLLLSILLFDMLFHSLFGGCRRFRLPIEWILIIFASYTIWRIFKIKDMEWLDLEVRPKLEDIAGRYTFKAGRIISILVITAFGLLIYYSYSLFTAYFHKEPLRYCKLSYKQAEVYLEKNGLLSKWNSQHEKISFRDLCRFLSRNKEYILKNRYEEALQGYSSYIVIWEGELNRIPKKGSLKGFDFTINPGEYDLGEGMVYCVVSDKAGNLKAEDFWNGQRAAIIAEIPGLGVLGTPMIVVYDIIPLQ